MPSAVYTAAPSEMRSEPQDEPSIQKYQLAIRVSPGIIYQHGNCSLSPKPETSTTAFLTVINSAKKTVNNQHQLHDPVTHLVMILCNSMEDRHS